MSLLLLAMSSCGSSSVTQLIVSVDGISEIRPYIVSVDIVITGGTIVGNPTAIPNRLTVDIGDPGGPNIEEQLPFTFGVVPEAGFDHQVAVLLLAHDEDGIPFVQSMAQTEFVSGDARLLRMVFDDRCLDDDSFGCEFSGRTCRDGICRDIYVPPSELPLYTSEEALDAGP